MLESLHLAIFRRDEHRLRARVVERLARTGHLDLLEAIGDDRSEEHTSELQSRPHLVCRLLLEKKNKTYTHAAYIIADNHLLPPGDPAPLPPVCNELNYHPPPFPTRPSYAQTRLTHKSDSTYFS